MADMGSEAHREWVAFEEKVKRTVYFDNLSPQVNEAVIKNALDQFGNVVSVQFIPHYFEPRNIPSCALVEMENSKQAKVVVEEISTFPFMMSGMPRPVRVRPAEIEMFETRLRKPGRKIDCCWLEPSDPDFQVAKKLKQLTRKHAAEAAFILKQQLLEEEKLSKQQADTLRLSYQKHEMVDGVTADGTARRLARHYGVKISDD